jgi:predicted secreted protein
MSLVSSAAIFFVIWWLMLFLVLPFGVKSQHEMDDVTLGTDRGAPHQPFILRRMIATTILAALVFACVYVFFGILGLRLEDLLS